MHVNRPVDLNYGEQAKSELAEVKNDVYRLRAELVEANSRLRSSYSVVERRGKDTNWEALKANLEELLEHQRLLINEWGGFVPETKVKTQLEIERLRAENAELAKASRDASNVNRLYREAIDLAGCPADKSQFEWMRQRLAEIAELKETIVRQKVPK